MLMCTLTLIDENMKFSKNSEAAAACVPGCADIACNSEGSNWVCACVVKGAFEYGCGVEDGYRWGGALEWGVGGSCG